MDTRIRLATEDDAPRLLEIYGPIVENTVISFEVTPPSLPAMQRRIVDTLSAFPWLVCERCGEVLGYAYAGKHRSRAAYQWSVDVSVYTDAAARRQGIGRALYGSLFRILALQGYCNAYAGIALPNPASVGLHEALGFQSVGVYRQVGYKQGAWHDVGWWQLSLQAHPVPPAPPSGLAAVRGTPEWNEALSTGLPLLHKQP